MSIPEKKIVIVQSNYIPWKGYFDLIRQADVFVLYDDMQYTRRDWRNRNLIKTAQGLQWLTIPVKVKGKYEQRIDETEVSEHSWAESHWKSINNNYRRAPFFTEYASGIQSLYEEASHLLMLSEINYLFLTKICQWLSIDTPIMWSGQFPKVAGRTENLVHLCQSFQATDYISGPSASNYIDIDQFEKANIRLQYMTYAHYPEYPQLYGDFVHGVSILDLLFNCGEGAAQFLIQSEPA
ncbi:WbqC family protein [Iodobacter fluviatilis]|uniref:WbqC-like protein n=1 Tax=Iodobacter fluviatilis TaxID=537 RepID=A0A377Q5P3_9NEIS|nr:WbqC family protein [Iodobacter fluviatilis]TCU89205.1 WbqC-like protein [Iodobacter fluviatilis]STQ90574.1 WbqC-like protein family [Iodobacter fluviatilis]